MTLSSSQHTLINVRPCQYRDLEGIEFLVEQSNDGFETVSQGYSPSGVAKNLDNLRQWYGPLKLLSWFPNPLRHFFSAFVAEYEGKVRGVIQVAPCNHTRSTWRIERIAAEPVVVQTPEPVSRNGNGTNHGNGSNNGNGGSQGTSHLHATALLSADIASQLVRYCLDTIWEARTWMVEVSVNDQTGMGLYRQHGFQPLAQMTYWAIAPDLLAALAEQEVDLPNLRTVSSADAPLLHQLDTVSMPPLVRQVYDRHVSDFKAGLARSTMEGIGNLMQRQEINTAYVFEPQRKAAIGYFRLTISQNGQSPHHAHLTVHPAYTWLYPELLAHMAQLLQGYSPVSLQIASSDYQPEREEYLSKIGAERTEHTLIMSRSVWHKVREAKPASLEGLQLSEVLQGLQPSRKPVPGRFSWIPPLHSPSPEVEAGDARREQKNNFQSEQSSQGLGRSQPTNRQDNSSGDCNDSSQWPRNGAT